MICLAFLVTCLLLQCSPAAAAASGCRPLLDGNPKLPDANFSASSTQVGFAPQDSRLSTTGASSGRFGSWAPPVASVGEYVQVDLGFVLTTAVAIRGREDTRGGLQWITKFLLSFSVSGSDWQSYDQEFVGNHDKDTILTYTLYRPQYTRFVRIYPLEWYRHMSLRWEVYGCPVTRPAHLTVEWAGANAITVAWHHNPVVTGTELIRCYKGVAEHFNATVAQEASVCVDSGSVPRLTMTGLTASSRYRLSLSLEAQGQLVSDPAVLVISTAPQGGITSTTSTQQTCAENSAMEDKLDSLRKQVQILVVAFGVVGGLLVAGLLCLVLVLSCKHRRRGQRNPSTEAGRPPAELDPSVTFSSLRKRDSEAYDTIGDH